MPWLLAAVPAMAAGLLAPHQASYRLDLHESSRGGEIAAIKGRLEVTFEASCDGWRIEHHLGFRVLARDGFALEHIAQLSGFEARDGSEFVFSTRTWEDRELAEEVAGVARRAAGGARVRYAKPEAEIVALPDGVAFPVMHLESLVRAARDGKRHVQRIVFDGSTRDNPFDIVTWITDAGRAASDAPAVLAGQRYWPLRIAYYPVGAVAPQPEFEMSVALFDDGIAGDMVYDYGDFAMRVDLEEVERLPAPEC